MDDKRYQSLLRLTSLITRWVGLAGLVGTPLFWAITNRLEPSILATFGTMAGIGVGLDVLKDISENKQSRSPEE